MRRLVVIAVVIPVLLGPLAGSSLAAKKAPFGTVVEFSIPSPDSEPPAITTGPDGNLWFTEQAANNIGRITPDGVITEFPVPTPNSSPSDIVAGPDGALWFTEFTASKIGRITTAGVVTHEFPIPVSGQYFDIFTGTLTTSSGPRGITVGPDGNLWFAEFNANRIGRITPDGVITEFLIPTPNARPEDITTGPDGNLWFTDPVGNKI